MFTLEDSSFNTILIKVIPVVDDLLKEIITNILIAATLSQFQECPLVPSYFDSWKSTSNDG